MKRVLFVLSALALIAGSLAGCAQAQPGTAEPIVIGVPTALGSIEGADALRAVEMAADEVNAEGGVDVGGEKRPFKVVSIDTREHEPGIPVHDALAAVEKLILEDKPDAILVGAFRSEVLLASMDVIAEHKIPYITTIAMTPAFQQKIVEEKDKYKYMFRTCLNAVYLVQYLSQTMDFVGQQFGLNKAYIVTQDVLWATGTGAGVEKWFSENGWEVVGNDAYPTGATDFSSSLTKAQEGGAQVIVPIFDMPQAGILVKQARSMQLPALVAGFISPVAPGNAWDVFDGEVDGMVNFIFEIGPLPVNAVEKSVDFNNKFAEKYGEEERVKLSGHGPGPSYDSVYVLKDAIERAGTLDPDALVTALEATDMQGVVGHIHFGDDHQAVYGLDPEESSIGSAFQWVAPGKRIPVFPAVAAEGEIQLPDSMNK